MLKKVGESLLALAIGLMCAYGLLCTYAAIMGDRLLFASDPVTYHLSDEYFKLTSRLGDEIVTFYEPTEGARYIVLYSHGQLEDLGFIRPRLEQLRRHGYSVIAYDYPGYGHSSGKKTQEGCFAAIEAVYDYLVDVLEVPPHRIIAYGRSMGSGPTSYLAERFKVGGTVLHGGFISAYRVQTGIQVIPWDRFENLNRVAHFRAPLLLVHGTQDEVVPEWHSRYLFQKAPLSIPVHSLFVPYALHNNVVEMAGDSYWRSLEYFVQTVDEYHAQNKGKMPEVPTSTIPPVQQ